MLDTPTLREQLEAAAARDPLAAEVLAEAKAEGLDWTATLELLVTRLQAERVKLIKELLPFRKGRVQMVPVFEWDAVEKHGFDLAAHDPASVGWIPVQVPPAPAIAP